MSSPKDFCIAVVGHPGWDRRLDASAPYALCMTIDVLGEDLDLHNDIEVALNELRVELGSLRVRVPASNGEPALLILKDQGQVTVHR